jgi:DNA-binding response OmpR family regulator
MIRNILLLEEDSSTAMLYSRIFQNDEVVVAPTLDDVFDLALLRNFNLCISETHIDTIPPETLLQALAQACQRFGFPVLVASAAAARYRDLCDHLGLHTLQKPFPNRILLATADAILAIHRDQQLKSG